MRCSHGPRRVPLLRRPYRERTHDMAKSKQAADKVTRARTLADVLADEDAITPNDHADDKFLRRQRKSLLAERAKYIESADSLKAEADALVDDREPGDTQFDEESGEGDSLAVERERDLALSAHARAAVEQIEAALMRIDKGTYGICAVSGKPIPKERLKAIPWASERVEYKAGGLGRR